jgi:hypothetical protein
VSKFPRVSSSAVPLYPKILRFAIQTKNV